MRRWMNVFLAVLFIALPNLLAAQSQVTEIPEIQISRTLSAVIQDPGGNPVGGAVVEEFSPDWKVSWRTGRTAPDGKFMLAAIGTRKMYYIQVTAPGYKTLHFRVQLNPQLEGALKLKLEKAK